MLRELLRALPKPAAGSALLVGVETGDDAAVYRIDDHLAVVATTDFFAPVVDDPFDYGRIAASNALSDIYAVGARPILALAIAGMPIDRVSPQVIQRIFAGGAQACAEAGIAVAGGHSIETPEPIYGLAAIGLIDPAKLKRNVGALPGDALILGKPLGTGVLAAAIRRGELSAAGYDELLATTTQLNTIGMALAERAEVHAMTDVTGFGLIGHLLEICRASGVAARLDTAALPVLATARELARGGVTTGAAKRNRSAFAAELTGPGDLAAELDGLLHDPQTNGGLLVACPADAAADILASFHRAGHGRAAAIGTIVAGKPGISLR